MKSFWFKKLAPRTPLNNNEYGTDFSNEFGNDLLKWVILKFFNFTKMFGF